MTTFWVILGLLIILGVWLYLGSKKKRWYKVYLANNDILLLSRDLTERWWRTSNRYMRFKNEFGKEFTFPAEAHWILYWEEVPDMEVGKVKEEIRQRANELARTQDA